MNLLEESTILPLMDYDGAFLVESDIDYLLEEITLSPLTDYDGANIVDSGDKLING